MNQKPCAFFSLVAICSVAAIFGCAPKPAPAALPTITSPPPNIRAIEGKLKNQVATLEEDLPRAFSEKFIVPSDTEKNDFGKIVSSIEDQNTEQALRLAAANQYDLLWYADGNDDNAGSFLLRENIAPPRGWGLYLFRAGSSSDIIVEAPHPLSDEGTALIAVDIYRALDARALLIAGAHRDANSDGSADAAHENQTVFQSAHESILQKTLETSGTAIVLHVHGFSSSKHPKYPQIIIGYGGPNFGFFGRNKNSSLAWDIYDALTAAGIKAGLCDGASWKDLCGGKNAQSASMSDGIFIHLEMNETMREEDKALIKALISLFAK
jgi:hypothetical protein